MRFHNFWCISFVASEFLKHVQKTPKSWEKLCSITIFHQNPEKHSYRLDKLSKLPLFLPPFFPDNHGQKSWDTFAFLGRLPIHTGLTPPLTPEIMLDACIQNFFRVSTLYRVGGRENCKKISKMMHSCFKREPRNDRKVCILQYGLKEFCPELSWLVCRD